MNTHDIELPEYDCLYETTNENGFIDVEPAYRKNTVLRLIEADRKRRESEWRWCEPGDDITDLVTITKVGRGKLRITAATHGIARKLSSGQLEFRPTKYPSEIEGGCIRVRGVDGSASGYNLEGFVITHRADGEILSKHEPIRNFDIHVDESDRIRTIHIEEADRKRGGEPVGYFYPWELERSLKAYPNGFPGAVAVYAAPQPIEPSRGEPVVLATYHAIVDESEKHIVYDTRTNQLEIYDEREDAVKAAPDHLSVVPVYVTATEGPLYTSPQPLSESDMFVELVGGLSAEQLAEILATYIKPEIIGEALEKLENAPWELSESVAADFPAKGKVHGPLGWIANNTNPEPVKVNAIFETQDGAVTGTTDAKVKRVEWQDDGSLTVVIDYWPQPA